MKRVTNFISVFCVGYIYRCVVNWMEGRVTPLYIGKSLSMLQIQVVSNVFEFVAGNYPQMAALFTFIVPRNVPYAHDWRQQLL
jgi:hypothetical protein